MTNKILDNPPPEDTATIMVLTPSQHQAALGAGLILFDREGREWLDSTPLVRVRVLRQIPR